MVVKTITIIMACLSVCVCERDHDDHGDDVMGGATASGKSSLNIK